MTNLIVLENIRSSYNTGNIIRTADALGWGVVLSGYTPDPDTAEKVLKTSLGAEQETIVYRNRNTTRVLQRLREQEYFTIGSELTLTSRSISEFDKQVELIKQHSTNYKGIAIIVGNEKTGILNETLSLVDGVYHIPMQGIKESLNVGQAAAIMMRECGKQFME